MYETSDLAEAAFYDSFEHASLETMMGIWHDRDLVCVHPMGPRLTSRTAIEQSWREVFQGGARLEFEPSDVMVSRSGDLAVHYVHENITYGPQRQRSLVIATNIYRNTKDGWKMVAHHASPGRVSVVQSAPSNALH